MSDILELFSGFKKWNNNTRAYEGSIKLRELLYAFWHNNFHEIKYVPDELDPSKMVPESGSHPAEQWKPRVLFLTERISRKRSDGTLVLENTVIGLQMVQGSSPVSYTHLTLPTKA